MTTHLTAKSKLALATLGALGATLLLAPAWAQNYPVSAAQRSTADSVAQKGVALSDLADNAPERYTVKSGDTLWGISTMYLKSPWRWPELWGMNRNDIQNPHRIYPGQVLVLERSANGASLRVGNASQGTGNGDSTDDAGELKTVRISPRTRYESLESNALPTLESSYIDAFLVEPQIVDVDAYAKAPRIVAAKEERVILGSGDRLYARGPDEAPLLDDQPQEKVFRILSAAKPLKHPDTGAVLGYETVYEGTARLVRGEKRSESTGPDGTVLNTLTPATIDIISAKQEINIGDRLLSQPALQLRSFTPHAPATPIESRIVSIYGMGVSNAAQKHVVAITGGTLDGIDSGTVLAILSDGRKISEGKAVPGTQVKLPNERIGLLMVFRSFDHLAYGLILEITDGVHVGDRLISPR